MFSHSRKLLLLAALCWIAPASAEQRDDQHAKAACPSVQSAALGISAFPGEVSLVDLGAGAPGLMP